MSGGEPESGIRGVLLTSDQRKHLGGNPGGSDRVHPLLPDGVTSGDV